MPTAFFIHERASAATVGPQRLNALREHALIESAVSSNRIKGASAESARLKAVLVVPRPLFCDRDEEKSGVPGPATRCDMAEEGVITLK
jgi:hypothetical protein